ncbi:MAG: hypothetical protein GF417_12080, partial [Candidatus Latescibacteria bacterium]|nr:hypothetical protein [bacterium]MBD3425165.1 hypothetical protein [Candidatus Latescibacterota bacterium]
MSDGKLYSILKTFLDDSSDTMEGIEEAILQLDSQPGDRDSLNRLFRLVHSFKGAARFMGFSVTSEFAHRIENILDGIRNRKYQYSQRVSDLLFQSARVLNDILSHIAESGDEKGFEFAEAVEELERFQDEGENPVSDTGAGMQDEQPVPESEQAEPEMHFRFEGEPVNWGNILLKSEKEEFYGAAREGRIWTVSFGTAAEAGMEIPRVMLSMRALEQESQFFRSIPPSEYIEEEYRDRVDLLLVNRYGENDLREILDQELEVYHIREFDLDEILSRKAEPAKSELSGVQKEEPVTKPGQESDSDGESDEPENEEEPVDQEVEQSSAGESSQPVPAKQSTVKVDIRKMDDLMNLLGELVINRTRSEDLVQELESLANEQKMVENLRESLNEQSQIINDIQDKVMSSRLVAVKSIFQEVSFVVRDMANRLGKEVDCRISGESTELDKRLVDSIRNPIMHVVKNAVDHGLEDPDEREEKGKERKGVITVEAHREHNQIIITISDDGRGIDLEKIREVAVKRGIMDPGHADSLSEEEIVGLLCLPGFSSREKVTGDSGRGVGMDVVKSILEEFNGKMEIHTEKDRGTCVLLRLPITLAIIRGLMI